MRLFIIYLIYSLFLFLFKRPFAYWSGLNLIITVVSTDMKNQHEGSDEELNEEINDKLNQLWTGMNDKRKKLVRNMTPGYSRRTDQSEIMNQSSQNNAYASDNQVLKIRDKLAAEVSASKHKDAEIDNLKRTIVQLTNDKKMLVYELQQVYNSSGLTAQNQNINSSLLNESSIQHSKLEINKNTANFESVRKKKKSKKISTIEEENDRTKYDDAGPENDQQEDRLDDLEKLSKARLLELLRSTAEYREFIYYYDSHELSYLKRLQEQHRKNCDRSASIRQKALWAPAQVVEEARIHNKKEKWGLNESQLESVLSILKSYYEHNLEERIKKMKEEYEGKLKKQQRESQYGIPYDLVQVCKAKERQLSKLGKRKKTNSFKCI